MTKEIQLTKGKQALVDDKDYEMLMALGGRWCVSDGYAFNRKLGRMHRFLLKAKDGVMVDHINGNKLDNRRKNLRLCTNSQNQMNRKKANGLSKFKGVVWQRTGNKGSWQARIVLGGKLTYIGTYRTDLEAAAAYNEEAKKHFGNFASLNDLSLPASPVVSHERRQVNRVSPSGYKGVTYDKNRDKWMAQLKFKGVSYLKQRFSDPKEAAQAYDKVARDVFGPTAVTNF